MPSKMKQHHKCHFYEKCSPNCSGKENTRCIASSKVALLGKVSSVVVSFQIGCCKFNYICSLEIRRTVETTPKGALPKAALKIFEKLTFVSESL